MDILFLLIAAFVTMAVVTFVGRSKPIVPPRPTPVLPKKPVPPKPSPKPVETSPVPLPKPKPKLEPKPKETRKIRRRDGRRVRTTVEDKPFRGKF